MKLKTAVATAVLSLAAALPATAQELTGDTKLACEAILCLSSGQRPDECAPSLARYFGISYRKLSDTIKGRINFLDLCPASSDSGVKQLSSALANGAGRCDVDSLNTSNRIFNSYDENGNLVNVISNQMPAYCGTMYSHAWLTDLLPNMPKYVGVPERGGYWVPASQYQAALAQYNARIAEEDRQRNQWRWNK